ncbi:hypothetical protein Misp06_02548 [Microbulbifer sp. NBRC 101763]|uniref:glutathione S-transferase family protein n=1 Tax=Microbulbifer sp. NBRC 101763 TaxID=1113820 RepID=UPI0030A1DE10
MESMEFNTPKVVLYTFATSPYGLKVQAFLAFKKIAYEIVYVSPFNMRETLPMGHTVPVLTIDGESKNDSQEIAHWLDERFPQRPLYPVDGDPCINELDDWVQHCMIPANFRFARPTLSLALPVQLINAWRLGCAMNRTVPDNAIGAWRFVWPLVLRWAPFVRREAENAPGNSIMAAARHVGARLSKELERGPFMCNRSEVSVADLSVYALLAFGYEAGLTGGDGLFRRSRIREWALRVQGELDPSLPLVPSQIQARKLGS